MSMDHLRSKTPDMVHKEIAVHFLAYNLIRTLIAEACRNTALRRCEPWSAKHGVSRPR